ncbi:MULTISPECIES: family 43 glycosylhydrolase [Segatella]|jgi:arabinan endo-1,5-alpha-L-arabinosidase|uniref:Endo-a1,5-arabinanase n=4 Tax=Prevotellaceae TaxID=171552 RepID=D8DXZ6_9BACT|nr:MULTISPECIES: family 43 glycosylhydrolase [Segatella]AGH13981.1 beta xylosidase [Prevotella sp. Sc00026]EFI71682.1 endo-a1,5-arabinanase [Segatella baroniae B14]OYP55926.1 arabinan endo-1,5-alpha-L-arabinosidase [Segatella bryantii]UKK74153.1 family 43 glycosylhydrolase [Segatella bryantii]UKK76513.1 family 43 glycosylhydrolase [Segatella bryantii]
MILTLLFSLFTSFTTDTAFVHDPVMAYENGIYYMYSTGRNIQVMTSPNRKSWTLNQTGVLPNIPSWTHDSVPGFKNHIWAPDIIQWHQQWWMAYSCSTFGKNTSAIGLLQASNLAINQWTDKGCLINSHAKRDNWNAIDPNFVKDEDDNLWLTFGSFWDGIQLIKLQEQNGTLTQDPNVAQLTIARRYHNNAPNNMKNPTSKNAGINAIEAPFIFKHDNWYYLFVSWDYCCRGAKSNYRVVVGRSRSITGPYIDENGISMTEGGGTLVLEGDKKVYEAAGHCAVYHFNHQDLFICHGYNLQLDGMSTLIQRKIHWKENGFPQLEE